MAVRVVFRVDAGAEIGTGHVMRCLTLAEALRDKGAECLFLCRPHEGNLIGLIADRGHRVKALPALVQRGADWTPAPGPLHAAWLGTDAATDAADCLRALEGEGRVSWLIVDHYALDREWQSVLRPMCDRLMVIDDLADRPHDCDLLLDTNLGRTRADYAGLFPTHARILAGPRHALLRPEFAAHRTESLGRRARPELRRLLVTLGGVDKDNLTCRVLDALDGIDLPGTPEITVVMGPKAPWLDTVRQRACAMRFPTCVLAGVSNMARLMTESDLAIGAAGTTAWERCCLGLPTIQLVLAQNQLKVAEALEASGAAVSAASPEAVSELLADWIARDRIPSILARMSRKAADVTEGSGARMVLKEMGISHA